VEFHNLLEGFLYEQPEFDKVKGGDIYGLIQEKFCCQNSLYRDKIMQKKRLRAFPKRENAPLILIQEKYRFFRPFLYYCLV
jgi:hypothetical protein